MTSEEIVAKTSRPAGFIAAKASTLDITHIEHEASASLMFMSQ